MISKSAVGIAEQIVVAGANINPSPILAGLVGESYGAIPYTASGFREEIVATTTDSHGYNETKSLVSDRLAEIIRTAMYNVRDYGVPLAKAIVEDSRIIYDPEQLREVATNGLSLTYVNLNDPFFDSPLFPTELRDKVLSYENIELTVLDRLQFSWPEAEIVREFVNSGHQDVLGILENKEDLPLNEIAFMLGKLVELKSIFTQQNGSFNFTQVKTIRISMLLKMYILLVKMYGSEQPAPWLTGGSLEDYRNYVNLMLNGLTAYLINLKHVVNVYKARELVMVPESTVRLSDHPTQSYRGPLYIQGAVRVFYSDSALEKAEKAGVGLTEVITGYYWKNLLGGSVTLSINEALANAGETAGYYKQYLNDVHAKLTHQGQDVFVKSGLKVIHTFIAGNELLAARVTELREATGELLDTWIERNFTEDLVAVYFKIRGNNIDRAISIHEANNGREDLLTEVLSTNLVTSFLDKVGCTLASEIVKNTFTTVKAGEDGINDKRQRLHVALINVLVDKLYQ